MAVESARSCGMRNESRSMRGHVRRESRSGPTNGAPSSALLGGQAKGDGTMEQRMKLQRTRG